MNGGLLWTKGCRGKLTLNLKRWMSGQMDALCNGQKISLNPERLVTKIKCVCVCVLEMKGGEQFYQKVTPTPIKDHTFGYLL